MQNRVVWFDIAVSDLDRAKEFYSKVFDVELTDSEMGPNKMSMFPFEPGVASGALVQGPDYKPSAEGRNSLFKRWRRSFRSAVQGRGGWGKGAA